MRVLSDSIYDGNLRTIRILNYHQLVKIQTIEQVQITQSRSDKEFASCKILIDQSGLAIYSIFCIYFTIQTPEQV